MKNMKKIVALMISVLLVLTSMSVAFAATGAQTPDTQMTIGGLDVGDVVSFYKLIKWVPGDGWDWNDGVVDAANTEPKITLPDLTTITGYLDTTGATPTKVDGVISAEDGGKLAQVAQRLTGTPHTETVGTGETSVTYSKPAYVDGATDEQKAQADVDYMGLYVALVKPATVDYLYNPIFVAADYNGDDHHADSSSITVVDGTDGAAEHLSYTPAAMAKKQKVELTKTSGTTADTQYDIAVGDTIPFTINSIVPEFSTSYLNPVYEITDTMDTGLTLLETPAIVVKVKETTDTGETPNWTTLTTSEYDITGKTDNGFTVALKSAYIKANPTSKNIQVTYSAKVTDIADYNVVQKENTATVKFSNNPGNSSDYSLLEDKTNHYTFSIDANLLGNDGWENSELVKIGLNPDGTEITQETLSNGSTAGVLEGAKFGLYTDATCNTLYTNSNVNPAVTGEYVSDAHGKLNISGLDVGTYYLKEISAPAGYIKSNDIWEIKITAHYDTVPAGDYTNTAGKKVHYDAYDYLTSYEVAVKNLSVPNSTATTSTFTMVNEGTNKKKITASGTDSDSDGDIDGTDRTTKLNNTRGTELPSTGGMGTTILYIGGSILVILAAVLLITKRRMNAED